MSPATRTAVRHFQRRYGLPATGYVGPDTQQALVATTSSDDGMQTDSSSGMDGAAMANQGVDASNAPGGVVVGAAPQNPPVADADAHELLQEYGLSSGEFELQSEFENWESGLRSEFEMEQAAPTPQRSTFALLRAIPDDPDYRKYVPLEYRLNAKTIIGEVAQDLKSNGEKAQFMAEMGHFGLMAAEIFAEGSLLVGGLAIAAPVLALVAGGLALGAPYYEAGQEIAANWAASGFSRGVVMGADRRSAKLVKDYFGNLFFSPNRFHPQGASIAAANHRMGLLVGYVQGRLLSKNQHAIFWHDLGHRIGDQSYRGPSEQWNRSQWIDWYLTSAAIFRRDHLDK